MPSDVLPPPPASWPYHRVGTALEFPRDQGWHELRFGVPDPYSGMEWVYLNSHLEAQDGSGRTFVLFAAYFTQHLRLLVVRAFDGSDRSMGSWTGSAWGRLSAAADRLSVRFRHPGGVDTWNADTTVPFQSRLAAVDDARKFRASLVLEPRKAPYEAGNVGHMPFGRCGDFFYYSLTRLRASGSLHLQWPDGRTEDVSVAGVGWFDHQWGSFFVTPFRVPGFEQYEWMSIQLETQDEILLTTVWEPDGTTPSLAAYGGAGIIRRDGALGSLLGAHRWTRRRFWQSPDQGEIYSGGWRFDAPEWDLHLEIEPRARDQLTPIVDEGRGWPGRLAAGLLRGPANWLGSFWEGSCRVRGTFEGRAVSGVAFAELVKRYEPPRFRIAIERRERGLTVLRWRVENPDEQVVLRSRVFLERLDGTVLFERGDLDVPVVAIDDRTLPRGKPLRVRVRVASLDGSIHNTEVRGLTLP